METGSSFDLSSIYNWGAGILSALVVLVAMWRIWKVYFGDSASAETGQIKAEDKGKKYLSQVMDAAVVIVLILSVRAILGFLTGWFAEGFGTFI